MVWSWSHSNEAYDNARNNLQQQDRRWLNVVYAEWETHRHNEEGDDESFDEEKYEEALKKAEELDDDVLIDYIWDHMSEQAKCENGGFEAWACPYGCGCHTVSFDTNKEDEE